jgi:hypothetical protein
MAKQVSVPIPTIRVPKDNNEIKELLDKHAPKPATRESLEAKFGK